jgi:hypothetical protein
MVGIASEAFPGLIHHILPPTKEGTYEEKIGGKIASVFNQCLLEKNPKKFASMTFIIDEAHKLIAEKAFDFEGVQKGQDHTNFGGVNILFRQLVFLSYKPLVGNASETARVLDYDLGSPNRDYMVEVLEGEIPYKNAQWRLSKPLLKVAAKFSPRNMHSLIHNAVALMEGRSQLLYPYGVQGVAREILERIDGKRQITKISAEIGIDKKDYPEYEEPLWFDKLLTTSSKQGSIRVLTKLGREKLNAKSRDARNGLTARELAMVKRWELRWEKAQSEE